MLTSFKKYVARDEEEILSEALRGASLGSNDDLLEMLDRFGCRKVPTKESMKGIILEVAHKELVQGPQYIADA